MKSMHLEKVKKGHMFDEGPVKALIMLEKEEVG